MPAAPFCNSRSTLVRHISSTNPFNRLSSCAQVMSEDFKAAQTRVRPSAMREVALELPRVAWGDVGGLEAIKQRLKEAVEWPQKHPEVLARLGAKVGLKVDPLMILNCSEVHAMLKSQCRFPGEPTLHGSTCSDTLHALL